MWRDAGPATSSRGRRRPRRSRRMKVMMSPQTKTMLAVATMLALTAVTMRATVVVPFDLVDLAGGARAIVQGRVASVEPRWTAGRRQVETLVRLEATGYLKGDLGRELIFKVAGGDLGTYRTVVVGAPRFVVGDEVVLFLGADGPSIPHVLGLGQGVFRVVTDRQGRRLVVPPPLLRGTTPQRVTRGDALRGPTGLDAFAGAVRAALTLASRRAPMPADRPAGCRR